MPCQTLWWPIFPDINSSLAFHQLLFRFRVGRQIQKEIWNFSDFFVLFSISALFLKHDYKTLYEFSLIDVCYRNLGFTLSRIAQVISSYFSRPTTLKIIRQPRVICVCDIAMLCLPGRLAERGTNSQVHRWPSLLVKYDILLNKKLSMNFIIASCFVRHIILFIWRKKQLRGSLKLWFSVSAR